MITVSIPLERFIPRHNSTRKRCDCPSGEASHERLTPEQRDYLRRAILWLSEHWGPNPSMALASFAIADACGVSASAIDRIVGGFRHHDVPALRAWIVARGAP